MDRHNSKEIVTNLRRVGVLVGQEVASMDAIRQISITEQTRYRWRKQHGDMRQGAEKMKDV